MALGATIHNFDIELADSDRQVYESLALRVARHPSESEEYLVARLLAYCSSSRRASSFRAGSPTRMSRRSPFATSPVRFVRAIDIGSPDAARLHRASKAAGRVAVYTHKEPTQFLKQLAGEKIHNAEALELYTLDRALVPRSSRASSGASPSVCRSPTANCTCRSARTTSREPSSVSIAPRDRVRRGSLEAPILGAVHYTSRLELHRRAPRPKR